METPIKQVSGGWKFDRIAYRPAVKADAIELIKRLRSVVELPRTDAMAGCRFKSDDTVYARLESMYTESDFARFPMACVEAALIDSAQSDFWYAHEKRYHDDPYDEPEVNDDDGND